jgi:hypothetical protein
LYSHHSQQSKEKHMANQDPRQAIIDYLIQPRIPISDPPTLPAPDNPDAPESKIRRGKVSSGGHGAKAESFKFHKERVIPGHQVHYVTFEDDESQLWHYTCYVAQDEQGGWHFKGGAGGGGYGPVGPVRAQPWANLGGGWRDYLYAGGHVNDNGLDIARVRLVSNDGTVLEDTVDDGIVLFVCDHGVELPLQAELYDRAGNLAESHPVFKHRNIRVDANSCGLRK